MFFVWFGYFCTDCTEKQGGLEKYLVCKPAGGNDLRHCGQIFSGNPGKVWGSRRGGSGRSTARAGRRWFRMNETMRTFCLARALVAGLSAVADAGPFHRRGRAVAVCTTTTATTTAQSKPAAKPAVHGDTSTAQGVALLIVNTGRFRHWGGYSGFEGIGMGATPEAAEANCCYRSRWVPRERAFARMANGMYVCVCRY